MNHLNECISVIIPIYNAEKYLQETIESVLGQTYQNWELILVNDGSTDNSAVICRSWCANDNRIKYIETKNQGACYARNKGIEDSKGEYIFFMDADDLLTPDCLQHLKDQLIIHSVDIVSGNSQAFKKNKNYAPCTLHSNDVVDSVIMLNDVLTGRTIGSIWGKLYKKKSIENVLFHDGLLLGQDINFLTRLFLEKKNLKVFRDSHVVYRYRIVGNSISHSKKNSAKKVKSYIDAMIDVYDNYQSEIQESCIATFSKNLVGSIFVYLREQPFLKKTVNEQQRQIVCELSSYITIESYAKPVEIILNGLSCRINIYFTFDQVKIKFAKYKNLICKK